MARVMRSQTRRQVDRMRAKPSAKDVFRPSATCSSKRLETHCLQSEQSMKKIQSIMEWEQTPEPEDLGDAMFEAFESLQDENRILHRDLSDMRGLQLIGDIVHKCTTRVTKELKKRGYHNISDFIEE